jgi:Arc/MetJ family transcription regulator
MRMKAPDRRRALLSVRSAPPISVMRLDTHKADAMVYTLGMSRTNIDIDDKLIRKARKLTGLKTKREIVNKSLELLVRTESRKGILRYFGSGVWKGDLKRSRRNRV